MKWPLVIACFFLPHSCIGCQFHERWNGRWFQSGVTGPVTINATEISNKGSCVENDNDKFLIHDQKDNCYRCMVIYERHHNVLQYKETYCTEGTKPVLELKCSDLTGDATMYSLFRMGVAPMACPIRGPLEFTYSLGEDKWCDSPKSRVEACTQESRLLLRYQACPNVHSTERIDVELECLATWKEGSTQYLAGRLHSSWKTNDETSYRCFIYYKTSNNTWNLTQSADAACSGFSSDKEGARFFRLYERTWSAPCKYPPWLVQPKSWVALDQIPSRLLASEQNLTILDINETRLDCHAYLDNHHQVKLVAKAMRECQNGYVCLVFHKRDDHVIEMQQSNWTQNPDEACHPETFNTHTTPYTTFITTEPMTKQCPNLGRYEVVSILHPHSAQYSTGMRCHEERVRLVDIGCQMPDRMEVATSCTDDSLPEYLCHGTWMENDTAYLVATTDAGRYCLVYSASAGSHELSVTGHLASCPRTSHRHPASWQVNLTAHAQCGDASSAITWWRTSGESPVYRLAFLWSLLGCYVAR